ncbi:MAG: relaxase/mobilization nuclease domain-containing protein [Lachnospiraceae bacterium]|nr:relaxase/mobilization nuclease domain-containing protein [Lachnospiraceae bacterium]
MAYTKIHAVTATVHKAVAYICNPDKTDQNILISSFGCSPETAAYDFKFALSKTKQSDPNKAFHLIQAFLPGEVSYDEAHQVGIELADRLLEGKYSYIVSTHIDKNHLHNHIIFCAADNIEHKKYHDCRQTYYHIRRLSDELCAEHNLSVIQPGNKRGKKYNEWQAEKSGSSVKSVLCRDIDAAVKSASSYETFLLLMQTKGYEVKGQQLEADTPKYIAFRPAGRERFIRGSVRSLGSEYTRERIKERIDTKLLGAPEKNTTFSDRKNSILREDSARKLLDTSADKFKENSYLKKWADMQNLKIAASIYSEVDSVSELEKQISIKSADAKNTRQNLRNIEHRLKKMEEIMKYAEQYQANHIYHIRYQKSKDKDRYFRQHETELLLHDGAENTLRKWGLSPKDIDFPELQKEYKLLTSQKETLWKNYRSLQKELKDFQNKQNNLNQYLSQPFSSRPQQDILFKK